MIIDQTEDPKSSIDGSNSVTILNQAGVTSSSATASSSTISRP